MTPGECEVCHSPTQRLPVNMRRTSTITILLLLSGVVALASCQRQVAQRPSVGSFADNINLATITFREVDQVLNSPQAVNSLTQCFLDQRRCRTAGELSFVSQVLRLGPGGRCYHCTGQEQKRITANLRRTVAGMQSRYRQQWLTVLPLVRNII